MFPIYQAGIFVGFFTAVTESFVAVKFNDIERRKTVWKIIICGDTILYPEKNVWVFYQGVLEEKNRNKF